MLARDWRSNKQTDEHVLYSRTYIHRKKTLIMACRRRRPNGPILKFCRNELIYLRQWRFYRGGQGRGGLACPLSVPELWPPAPPPIKLVASGCKIPRLHIQSVESHIDGVELHHSLLTTQSYTMSSGILATPSQMWPPRWPPQTAAAPLIYWSFYSTVDS